MQFFYYNYPFKGN